MGASSSTTRRRSTSSMWVTLPRSVRTRSVLRRKEMSDKSLLVDAQWLSRHPEVRAVDLRWSAAGPPAREKYDRGHIPGAVFVDLDRDLSQPGGPGRHPFPSADRFAALLGRLGIGPETHVVVYDDTAGTVAARLWFMMRVHGLPDVSLLDGGLKAWVEAGLPLETAESRVEPVTPPRLSLDRSRVLDVEEVVGRGGA